MCHKRNIYIKFTVAHFILSAITNVLNVLVREKESLTCGLPKMVCMGSGCRGHGIDEREEQERDVEREGDCV